MRQLATISRIRAFRACPRYHHLNYNERWEAVDDDEGAAAYGSAGHLALEAWWKMLGDGAPADQALDVCRDRIDADERIRDLLDEHRRESLRVIITGYHHRWWEVSQRYEVLHVEAPFRTVLRNPTTGRPLVGWDQGGKMDVLLRDRIDGREYVMEHKFSGEDVSPGSLYWQRLRVDGQISIYLDGARSLGYDVAGCIYDVIAKPSQRPLKATPDDKRKYTKEGKLYANQRESDETPAEYGARIADLVANNPDYYYGRGDVVRFDEESEDARLDVYEAVQAMRDAIRTGRHYRNTDACTRLYGRVCPYLPVCSREATLTDPAKYRRREHQHPELAGTEPGGAEEQRQGAA